MLNWGFGTIISGKPKIYIFLKSCSQHCIYSFSVLSETPQNGLSIIASNKFALDVIQRSTLINKGFVWDEYSNMHVNDLALYAINNLLQQWKWERALFARGNFVLWPYKITKYTNNFIISITCFLIFNQVSRDIP